MDLERLSVALRPRNSWEAVDLGLRLAMTHLRPLYAAWLAVTVPTVLVLYLICRYWLDNLVWLYFFVWWCKPLFDRVALHVISHAVFGDTPTVRETLRALPRLLRTTRVSAGLLWNWANPLRPVTMAVDMLEGLRGGQARMRKSLIRRRVSGTSLLQSLLYFWILQPVLWMALLGCSALIVPEDMWPDLGSLQDYFMHAPMWFSTLLYGLGIACGLLLEPLYVASGFMLYIKRRTDLEAWDVELQFRRLAKAEQERNAGTLATRFFSMMCAALLLAALGMVPVRQAYADTPADTPAAPLASAPAAEREHAVSRAPDEITQVMKDKRFGHTETTHQLHWKETKSKEKDRKVPAWLQDMLRSLGDSFQGLGGALSMLGRVGAWILILLVVVVVLYLASRMGWLGRRRSSSYTPPAELAGFDIRPQSLPDDIAAAALALLAQGNSREALSLLFRGSLSRLAHGEQVPFGRGDTEGDCLARVHRHAPACSRFMTRLLGCWQRLAYAHETIRQAEIEALCMEWRHEFQGAQGA
jgi:hypothetical protein